MPPLSTRTATTQLARVFRECGYIRRQNARLLARHGYDEYKKGSEVRLRLTSAAEVRRVRQLLAAVGFTAGKAFRKGPRHVLPIYSADAVKWFTRRKG